MTNKRKFKLSIHHVSLSVAHGVVPQQIGWETDICAAQVMIDDDIVDDVLPRRARVPVCCLFRCA